MGLKHPNPEPRKHQITKRGTLTGALSTADRADWKTERRRAPRLLGSSKGALDLGMDRRLSAILVADMVGYSRLMEADEVGTLARQARHRAEVIDPAFARHGGRIFKATGDGLLAEFPSVVEAVACAVTIQRELATREADIPEAARIAYRVGINLGDVIHDRGDLHGDGVNVAARLEQMAEPGGICLSGTAHDHLRSAVEVGYEDLGELQVKNIARPIRAWRVLLDPGQAGQVIAKPAPRRVGSLVAVAVVLIALAGGVWWWLSRPDFAPVDPGQMTLALPDKPSIAILPFANLSGDPGKDWIGDGLTESIISTLSVTPEMVVMGRGTAFAYKDRNATPREVAEELGVRYVLTGSVQSSDDELRVTTELSDAIAGQVLWSLREDGTADDLFQFQDEIARKLFVELQVALTTGESSRTLFALAGDFDIIKWLIDGRVEFQKFSPEGHAAAERIWSRIDTRDPDNPLTPYLMGYIAWQRVILGLSTVPGADFDRARDLARQSLARHEFGDPYALLALIEAGAQNHDVAITHASRGIALSPGSADVNAIGGNALYMSGAVDSGLTHMLKGMRLEPDFPEWLAGALYPALLETGRVAEAISLARSVLAWDSQDLRARGLAGNALIVAFMMDEQVDAARRAALDMMLASPSVTAKTITAAVFRGHKPRPFHAVYRDALIRAGIPAG